MKTTSYIYQRFICFSLLSLIGFIFTPMAFSQSVTILPGGITPNQSGAMPRLGYDAVLALPSPQNGDMVYDVTFNCVRYYRKNKWVKMLSDFDVANPSMIGWQIGGSSYDSGASLATDAAGNIYVTGTFMNSAVFDGTQVTDNGTNSYALFIAKYTSTGHLLWVKLAGSVTRSYKYKMALDAGGNIFLAGSCKLNEKFGTATISSAGQEDVFLAKYSSNGTFQWIRQAGGTYSDDTKDLGVDGDGNVYITGFVKGNVVFGGENFNGNIDYDIFIAKYKSDGTFQWLRRAVSKDTDNVGGLVVDTNGKLTIIGHFQDAISFNITTLNSVGGSDDVFVARYDSTGNLIWANALGGAGDQTGVDIALDAKNELYICGNFTGTATLGSSTFQSAGGSDIFIAKIYNTTGSVEWASKAGGPANDICNSMAADSNGNVYITGDFGEDAAFGGTIIYGKAFEEIFVAKYNSKGDFIWVKEMGGDGPEESSKIVTDTKGNVYVTGIFGTEFLVDDITFNTKGVSDIFVARIRD